MRWLYGALLLAALVPSGCSWWSGSSEEILDEDTVTRLDDKVDIVLAEWLNRPRPELARLVAEWNETVQKQLAEARDNPQSVILLPKLHPTVGAPVFRSARYSETMGFSLPGYADGAKDAALALHLARFGDTEAARRLADPRDRTLRTEIDRWAGERNYPVEWVQVVGLVLQSAELKLANGEIQGATELVLLHQQLRALLDGPAATGPLGAALLPAGRRALADAAVAWRDEKKTALANDIDGALKDWGKLPAPAPLVTPKTKGAEVARAFGSPVRGRAVVAETSEAVQRAVDLLGLPVVGEGVEGVVASLDGDGRLTEVLFFYNNRIKQTFPEPTHLAQHLIDLDFTSQAPVKDARSERQSFLGGGLIYDVLLAPTGSAGAFVRVADAGARPVSVPLPGDPRNFGAAHLDRSFEQNRLNLFPDKKSEPSLDSSKREVLAKLTVPVTDPAPGSVTLQREGDENLVASLILVWPPDQNAFAFSKLALPLFGRFGAARLESAEDSRGGHLALVWEDERTRWTLALPFDEVVALNLVVADRGGPDALRARADEAARRDLVERRQRIEKGKPQVRLPRGPSVAQVYGDGVRLGLSRKEALAALPRSPSIRRQESPGVVNLLFLGEPAAGANHWARQMVLRFGADDTLAEIRVRYIEGLRPPTKENPTLLESLRRPGGAPEVQAPGPWAGLWSDLPPQKPAPEQFRWQDDRTLLTLLRDGGGAEVSWRDCPVDEPKGIKLPPLQFTSRGVEGCVLGDGRAEVLKRWAAVSPPTTPDGAVALGMPTASPYDALLVWFEGNKAVRVVARHKGRPAQRDGNFTPALQEVWGRDFDRLGAVRRQEGASGPVFQAYSWHDDRTRVRSFVQDGEDGPRLFTEWREWPIPLTKTAAAP
jgi:hypothetical protein